MGIAIVEKSVEARQVADTDAKCPVVENISIYLVRAHNFVVSQFNYHWGVYLIWLFIDLCV